MLQAGVVYAGTALGFALSAFAALNLAFTGIWIVLAAALARDYKKQSHRRSQQAHPASQGSLQSTQASAPASESAGSEPIGKKMAPGFGT